jgi:tRNA (cytidine/uridine-2'-O-)-methyltransferase
MGGETMHIVLVNPEIPQNTGNIARTCAATGMTLHLIKPLGFSLSDRYLKRAGLDYWHMMEYRVYDRFDDLLSAYPDANMRFLSTKAEHGYTEVAYGLNDFLVFGCETRGLPESLLQKAYDRCVRIPMAEGARSLNLSNSVAIVAYEALRQQGFPNLKLSGELTGRDDPGEPWMDYV